MPSLRPTSTHVSSALMSHQPWCPTSIGLARSSRSMPSSSRAWARITSLSVSCSATYGIRSSSSSRSRDQRSRSIRSLLRTDARVRIHEGVVRHVARSKREVRDICRGAAHTKGRTSELSGQREVAREKKRRPGERPRKRREVTQASERSRKSVTCPTSPFTKRPPTTDFKTTHLIRALAHTTHSTRAPTDLLREFLGQATAYGQVTRTCFASSLVRPRPS